MFLLASAAFFFSILKAFISILTEALIYDHEGLFCCCPGYPIPYLSSTFSSEPVEERPLAAEAAGLPLQQWEEESLSIQFNTAR